MSILSKWRTCVHPVVTGHGSGHDVGASPQQENAFLISQGCRGYIEEALGVGKTTCTRRIVQFIAMINIMIYHIVTPAPSCRGHRWVRPYTTIRDLQPGHPFEASFVVLVSCDASLGLAGTRSCLRWIDSRVRDSEFRLCR